MTLKKSPSMRSTKSVGTGFVHRLAGFDVGADLVVRHRAEKDARGHGEALFLRAAANAHARADRVSAAGKRAQHTQRVLLIARFAKTVIAQKDHCVRRDDEIVVRAEGGGCVAFFLCNVAHRVLGRKTFRIALVNVEREGLKVLHADAGEQLLTARGLRCQNDCHDIASLFDNKKYNQDKKLQFGIHSAPR